ncbi:lysine exporter LysO family protein [Parendozoicomonas sp. Alg238-R29]|uniref:lysine exporter LysO family protein n=1 Tax=Parendozoicomonas sp. Alg238-R29 TaxID=2993446 RepID=UPI00248DAD73|nr:lysine exporter LysO family protein [Parendozoicomonas sp. Alg238-R29]
MDSLIILLPLFLGYFIKLSSSQWLKAIDKALLVIIFSILFIMGMEVAGLDNLAQEIKGIVSVVGVLIGLTLLANLIVLPVVDWFLPLHLGHGRGETKLLKMLQESVQLIFAMLAGFGVGLFFHVPVHFLETLTMGILMVLLLLIGVQMRASGMNLRQILINPRGLVIASLVLISSLLAGIGTALWFDMPVPHGLALASGVGWYSLSGVLVGSELGPVMGSIAFLSDLARELIALVIIPILMPRSPASAIGYGGATSMDFTLPVIQRSGGPETAPVAIVSGFLLSFPAPILIPLFTSMA